MNESEKLEKCEHPEKLKGKPGYCSQEQILECHGKTRNHPCAKKD